MIKYLSTIFLLLTICLFSHAQNNWSQINANKTGDIIVYYHPEKPYFFEEGGKLKGSEYELFEEFINFTQKRYKVSINVSYKPIPVFKDFFEKIKTGQTGEFGLGNVSITASRKKDVKFSAPYIPDINVLISSSNMESIYDSIDISPKLMDAKGLYVENTVYYDEMYALKKKYPNLNMVAVPSADDIYNRVATEEDRYAFCSLEQYLKKRIEGIRLRRQVLFQTQGEGIAMIYPLNSDWDEPVKAFFGSDGFKNATNSSFRKYFGDEVYKFVIQHNGDQRLISIKETEIREKELDKEKAESDKAKGIAKESSTITYIVLGLLLLIVVLLLGLYSRYLYKNKMNTVLEKLNKQVEAQKKQVQNANTELKALNDEVAKQRDELSMAKDTLEAQNKKVLDSINAAKSIQTALLPYENRMKESFDDYFVIWNPKDVVSGDFYWLSQVGNTSFVAVIDCTGHGVPGAFVSMLGFALLNDIVNVQKIYEPNKILEHLHTGIEGALMQGSSDEKHGMDVCLCRVDKISDEDYQLIYAGAKRPLYIFQNGKLGKLSGDRIGVGGGLMTVTDSNLHFNNYGLSLKKGDILYLTTDGYADTPNTERKKLGTSQFEEYLKQYAPFPMKWQKNKLLQNLSDYQQGVDARDDVTVLGVKL